MPQTIIKDILTDATSQIAVLAESTVSKYKKQAVADGKKIVTDMKNDLTRWVSMLEDRKLTTAEFELLVKSYKTQIAMNGLLLAGLGAIRASEFGLGGDTGIAQHTICHCAGRIDCDARSIPEIGRAHV